MARGVEVRLSRGLSGVGTTTPITPTTGDVSVVRVASGAVVVVL
jgi:hypothetical protein